MVSEHVSPPGTPHPAAPRTTTAHQPPAPAVVPPPLRRSPADVEALVLAHVGVATAIARRLGGGSRDLHDLEQVAYVGLVKAAQRFDPFRGDAFVSYAVPTISGEIKRYLRDCGWVVRPPREVQELRGRLTSELPRLSQALGREPSPRDLATALGQDLRSVQEALDAHHSMRPLSLDTPPGTDGDPTIADLVGDVDPGTARAEDVVSLAAACTALDARERRIVYLRFFEERSQQEIGAELGVSQMQVSRLLRRIFAVLREELTGEPSAAGSASAGAAPAVSLSRQRGRRPAA